MNHISASAGGAEGGIADEGVASYLAIYELESPDVPESEAFRKASDSGEWPTQVRPYCSNRARIV
jgi:hypothetical protein